MTRYVLTVAALTVIYALTLASFDRWDLALGALLSTAVVVVFRTVVFEPDRREGGGSLRSTLSRIVWFVPMAVAVVVSIVRGTWQVLLIVLGIRPLSKPGIVEVPIGDRTPAGVAVYAIAETLSPGTVFLDVDWERRMMIIHAIDATDPEAFRAERQAFYERYQRRVFP